MQRARELIGQPRRSNRFICSSVFRTMNESNNQNEVLFKILGGVFAAVVAPILTGIVLFYIQKRLDDPKPEPPAADAKIAAAADAKSGSGPTPPEAKLKGKAKTKPKDSSGIASAPNLVAAATPSVHRPFLKKKAPAAQRLFNGQDLAGFDTYLGPAQTGNSPYGKDHDPERVFTVHGGQLHISGKVYGGLLTQSSFENYHLTLEYKWGEKKWPPRQTSLRASGVVLHASGTPGEDHGWSTAGIKCHIGEVDTGALSVPNGLPKPISLSAEAERLPLKKAERVVYVYKPGVAPHNCAVRLDPSPRLPPGAGPRLRSPKVATRQ